MLKVENTEEKEKQIMDIISYIASWYNRWEEVNDGQRIVHIEYQMKLDKKRDGVYVDGEVV